MLTLFSFQFFSLFNELYFSRLPLMFHSFQVIVSAHYWVAAIQRLLFNVMTLVIGGTWSVRNLLEVQLKRIAVLFETYHGETRKMMWKGFLKKWRRRYAGCYTQAIRFRIMVTVQCFPTFQRCKTQRVLGTRGVARLHKWEAEPAGLQCQTLSSQGTVIHLHWFKRSVKSWVRASPAMCSCQVLLVWCQDSYLHSSVSSKTKN